ncbi:hypothetical protein [Xanthocytophaga agilis]|uniref:Uncharacterized protein n=1 Tax=Xanthocytophaga agilis TaxID=3048010 RepID=A0AAE3R410_9BACT|nr:hypothetical protein [Xanthocytophaga agilis]MDJ1500468.1 hypothetical protein [Xanthocytophaga agilis]
MPDLTDLLHVDGDDNTSGVGQYIYVAKEKEILVLPLPDQDDSSAATGSLADLVTITRDIEMLPGKDFKRIYVTLETGELKHDAQGELDGMSFLNQLDFFMPGSRAEVLGFAQWAKNSSLIFLIPELDGQIRMLGHRAYPAKMIPASGTTGKASADRKGSNFSFKSVRKGPAPIFAGRVKTGSGSGASDYQDLVLVD